MGKRTKGDMKERGKFSCKGQIISKDQLKDVDKLMVGIWENSFR